MAIIARASITLAQTVDISGYYRFYKLQASTAAKPAKPTSISTLPPSGWSDTEPSYTEGSTNSLYFVDLTTFSDGTFEYSDVSLSSSYEAAKQAYNKSLAAMDAVDNLEIGGRNLIWHTNTPDPTNSQTRPNINGHWEGFGYMVSPNTSQALTVVAEHGLKTTAIIQYAPWFYFGYSGSNQQYIQEASGCFGLEPGKTYTWSADIKCKMLSAQTATATRRLGMYFYYRTADNTSLVLEEYKYVIDYPVAEQGTEKSVHGVLTFTVPSDADGIRLVCRCDQQTSSWFAVGDYLEMSNVKLEEGQKATAWTPAPEDIDSDISNVETNLANTKTALEDDIYGEPFYQYTTGGVTYDVWKAEDGKYYYDDGSETGKEVAASALDQDSDGYIIVRHGGLQDSVEKIAGSVLVDELEPSVTIQAKHTENTSTRIAAVKITDERVSFNKNGEEVAYIDSEEDEGVIDINNARIHVSLRIGQLELFDYNGGIGVRRYE